MIHGHHCSFNVLPLCLSFVLKGTTAVVDHFYWSVFYNSLSFNTCSPVCGLHTISVHMQSSPPLHPPAAVTDLTHDVSAHLHTSVLTGGDRKTKADHPVDVKPEPRSTASLEVSCRTCRPSGERQGGDGRRLEENGESVGNLWNQLEHNPFFSDIQKETFPIFVRFTFCTYNFFSS